MREGEKKVARDKLGRKTKDKTNHTTYTLSSKNVSQMIRPLAVFSDK